MHYLILFLISCGFSALLIPGVKKIAARTGALDVPDEERKIHAKAMPLLGGFAVYISSAVVTALYLWLAHPFAILPTKFYFAMALGGLVLMVGGFLDDRYRLKPYQQIFFPALASLLLVASGIGVGITQLSNPFGTPFHLGFLVAGIPFSAIFVFLFVLGMIYTTKFLDGMDGLASGISFIASLTLFFLSLTPRINQSITASLTIIFCGATLGFLFYNFNPASIFLGESGSTFMGFMLGALSVLLGGKIATAVLVMGIPILDVVWVITRRLVFGGSPFKADRLHLHFRLLDIGLSQRQTVLVMYAIAALFGAVAIFLQTLGKLVSLVILICLMVALAATTVVLYREKGAKPAPQPKIDGTTPF